LPSWNNRDFHHGISIHSRVVKFPATLCLHSMVVNQLFLGMAEPASQYVAALRAVDFCPSGASI